MQLVLSTNATGSVIDLQLLITRDQNRILTKKLLVEISKCYTAHFKLTGETPRGREMAVRSKYRRESKADYDID
jgi:hypothetical protein